MRKRGLPGFAVEVLCASVLSLLLSVALSSCAPGAGGNSADADVPFATAAKQQLEKLPGVESVQVGQSPLAVSVDKTPDPADAAQWRVSLDVRMLGAATDKQVATAATAAHAFSESHATHAPWTASILAGGDATPYAGDTTALPAVQVQVFPTGRLSAAVAARGALAAKRVPGVNRVAVGPSLASVEVLDVAELASAYDRLQHLALFEHGGDYGASAGRVQMMDVPARVRDASIHAIIDLGVRYPGANIALTAVTVGPQYPELYLDHVSQGEASEITATLTGLDRAAVTVGDYPLPFHMRGLGPNGTTDTSGYFGGTP
jgi:hypothetical protein